MQIKIAIYGSLVANCILAVLQLFAAVSSLSLSFFATASDSVFDPAANVVLNWAHRKGERADSKKYPSGGSRRALKEPRHGGVALIVRERTDLRSWAT